MGKLKPVNYLFYINFYLHSISVNFIIYKKLNLAKTAIKRK